MHGANHSSGTWQRETYKRVGRCGSYASCAASGIDTMQHHNHMTRGGHLLIGWELASSTKRYAVCRKGVISSLRGQQWLQKRSCDVQKGRASDQITNKLRNIIQWAGLHNDCRGKTDKIVHENRQCIYSKTNYPHKRDKNMRTQSDCDWKFKTAKVTFDE
jgi:hypothetical protein